MRNRAKCKLCNDILESFHRYDYVNCKCGEISISGGPESLDCSANDWKNFLRVDDEGNEIVIKVLDPNNPNEPVTQPSKLDRKEKIEMLEQMAKNIENLPKQALELPITHYDFYSFILLVTEIFKSETI